MKNKTAYLTVDINDAVITPASCAKMVIELIKYIAYHKELIPYSYERLKLCISKQKENFSMDHQYTSQGTRTGFSSKSLLVMDKYLQTSGGAYESFENIFKHINDEMANCMPDKIERIEEIIILLGSTILSPQDIFRIQIPTLDYVHSDRFHSIRKNHEYLYRSIFGSEQFHGLFSKNIGTNNLYVLFKMRPNISIESDLFIPRHNFQIPKKGQHAVICFKTSPDCATSCCCLGMNVFNDSRNEACYYGSGSTTPNTDNQIPSIITQNSSNWYQIRTPVKRIIDMKVNGISVPNIWVNPELINNL